MHAVCRGRPSPRHEEKGPAAATDELPRRQRKRRARGRGEPRLRLRVSAVRCVTLHRSAAKPVRHPPAGISFVTSGRTPPVPHTEEVLQILLSRVPQMGTATLQGHRRCALTCTRPVRGRDSCIQKRRGCWRATQHAQVLPEGPLLPWRGPRCGKLSRGQGAGLCLRCFIRLASCCGQKAGGALAEA